MTREQLEYRSKHRPKDAKLLEICSDESGDKLQIYVNLHEGCNTLDFGIMLASAARVIAGSIREHQNLPESEIHKILDSVVTVFNNDIKMQDMGEYKVVQTCAT
jgi:hypothetical protein